jgi:hypothetical protein
MSYSKERYDEMKKRADETGIVFLTKWRKGLKNIKIAPIVLGEHKEVTASMVNIGGMK